MPDYKLIKVVPSPGRLDIVLNSPPLNILNIAMMSEITAALEEAAKDTGLKALVVRAEGKHFSVGADVGEHTADKVEGMIAAFGDMFRALMKIPAVTIAAVDGSALGGGCELATFCDIVLASDRSKFGQPEIQLGVLPPVAAVVFPRLIGRSRTLELLTTGKIIPAQEAERIGLINHVYSAGEFVAKVDEFVGSLTALSATSIALTKKAVDKGLGLPIREALEEADQIYLQELMQTHDANEGLAAFLEKRKAQWKICDLDKLRRCLQDFNEKYPRPAMAKLEISKRYDLTTQFSEASYPEASKPGVYIFFDEEDRLLYIGKASCNQDLGHRLGAHFRYSSEERNQGIPKDDCSEGTRFVRTIPMERDRAFEAPALEEYLIGVLKPLRNKTGKST